MATSSVICSKCDTQLSASALFCPACGTAKSRDFDGDPLLGTVVGERFLIQERIGHGASGSIYRAEHVTLRRKVAVKVLHHELSRDDLAIERFRREATTVSEIDNEHIVEIHDFGRIPDGRLYLAMELLEGQTLDNVLAEKGALPVDQVVDVLIQLGEALMEAHAIGYIHRDLRPRNIYLAQRRHRANFVKLLDFGLAKLVEKEGEAASTSLGMTFGEPKYMSPEQARGDAVDRRADIYSLGCIAYEMLIGEPPFVGARVFDILTKHVETPPEPPASRRADVPPWLNAAITRMLAKRPDDRFTTVYRMVEALRQGAETGETMSDRQARKHWTVPPPSASREMQRFGLDPDKAHQIDPRKTIPAGLVGGKEVAAAVAARATHLGHGSQPQAHAQVQPRPQLDPEPVPEPIRPRRRTASPTPPPDSELRRRNLAEREMLPPEHLDPERLDEDEHEDDEDMRATRRVDPARVRRNAAASGKNRRAADDSSAGISAAWFADGEVDDSDDDLDDGYRRRLEKARANVSPSASHTEDIYFDGGRGPAFKVAIGVGAALVIGLVAYLAWPGGDGKEKSESAKVTAPAPLPDAGAAVAIAKTTADAAPPVADPKPTGGEAKDDQAKDDQTKVAPDKKASTPSPAKKSGKPKRRRVATAPPIPKPPVVKPTKPDPPKPNGTPNADKAKADFYAKLGKRALRQGDIGNAAINFNKARQLDKGNVDAVMGLREIALRGGSYGPAIGHLKRAARMRRSSHVLTLLGEAYLGAGNNAQAAKHFQQALKINPDNARARNGYNEASK